MPSNQPEQAAKWRKELEAAKAKDKETKKCPSSGIAP